MKEFKPEDRIEIVSLSNSRVGITDPEMRFKRIWENKGTKKFINFGVLEELIYENGVRTLFTEGFLDIPSMEAKIALGLEQPDAEKPENIIILTDSQRLRALSVMPIPEFKQLLATLPREQIMALTDFAIEKELGNFEKRDILKEITGIDIIKAIELKRANEGD